MTSFFTLIKLPTLATLIIAISSPAWGTFTLIDDFESGNIFSGGSTVSDPGAPPNVSNTVLGTNNTGTTTASLGVNTVPLTGISTLFFQMRVPEDNVDISFGLADDSGTGFGDFVTQVFAVGEELRIREGDGGGSHSGHTVGVTPLPADTWYNVWTVLNPEGTVANPQGSYDVYVSTDPYGSPMLVASDHGFRATPTVALDRLMIIDGGSGDQSILIDNIFLDATQANLWNPAIPEPSRTLLLFAGLIVLALRRKR